MPKQQEAPLGVHLIDAARQLSRLMARAVLSPDPAFVTRKFLSDAQRVAQEILDTADLSPAARQRTLDETTERWSSLAASRLEQMRTQRQTRRRPSVLGLARDALALPAHPQSRTLAEYAIVSGLRQAYGIGSTLADVEALRQSCENLASTVAASQRRRALKSWSSTDFFALDVMVLRGHIQLAPGPESLRAQLAGFLDDSAKFGVASGRRDFGNDVWPELFGEVPSFGTLLQEAYGQPLGVPGLDDALGGLLPAFGTGKATPGLVTLVVGPPGSGKTALCQRVARTLAQFGSSVRFLVAEESLDSFRSKEAGFAETRWWASFCPGTSRGAGDLALLAGTPATPSVDLAKRALREFGAGKASTAAGLSPAFPRVLVVDGASALLEQRKGGTASSTLKALRDAGVCVFLTCSPLQEETHQLGYVADNVFRLGFERQDAERHETRTLTFAKTRLQHNDRGRHVLQVGGGDSVSSSPSLDSVLRRLERSEVPGRHALIHLPFGGGARSLAPRLVDPSQSLVFGAGSTGKARFGLSCLLAPRGKLESDQIDRKERAAWAERSRTLVISFLYPAAYYADIGQRIAQSKHHHGAGTGLIDTWAPYPGFIEAETFVEQVQRKLDRADLEGKPYTGVLVDGVHTLLLEFPLLRAHDLLWPCLYRLLRARNLTAVSTFTSFGPEKAGLDARSEQFLRMLIGACDYGFNLSRSPDGTVTAEIQATIDNRARRGAALRWDPEALVLGPLGPTRPRAGP